MIPAAFLLLASAWSINHQPIDCFVKDRFALLEIEVKPALDVTRIRLFFKSSREDEYHYVPMVLHQGRFVGKLPRPKEKAQSVTYYIEIAGADGTVRKTPEITGQVAKSVEACPAGSRIADAAEESDVRVWTAGSSRGKPKEFAGVEKVVREGDAAGENEHAASAPPPAGETAPPASAAPAPPVGAPVSPSVVPTPLPAAPLPTPRPVPDEGLEFSIGPEDIVRVTVLGHEDLTQTIVVQSDGTFIYPLIGRVKAGDLTPKELERKITTLLAQGYVRNPQVTVSVQEYRSKTVFVVGEVSRPGSYSLSGRMTVLELLSKAGPTSAAGVEVVIVRPKVAVSGPLVPVDLTGAPNGDSTDQADLIRVNIRDIQMGQLDKNVLVRPNDTVFVTQAARIFVTGEVRTPGAITYWPGATVRKAINTAGGFSADAATGRLRVVREVEGKTKEMKIGLDDPVQPGDTIIVKAKLF
jgi:polysaccharide export outer membrane protein